MRTEAEFVAEIDRRARITLWLACVVCTLLTLWVARDRDRLRNSDEAAYAEQARSLLDDGTLEVGFVRHYHVPYPAAITHPEDFYPPGNGVLLAASWSLFGRSDLASCIPSLLFACLLIPLLSYLLARRLGASVPFSVCAAITVMAAPIVRDHAYQGLADLPFTAAVLVSLLLGLRHGPAAAVGSGLALAAAFWFKPTALLLVPAMAFVHAVGTRWSPRAVAIRWFWFGLAFGAAVAPWLIRNLELFGDPLYSGNKHLSATANDPEFQYTDVRKVYWFHAPDTAFDLGASFFGHGLPAFVTRFTKHLYQTIAEQSAVFGWPFLCGALFLWRERRVFTAVGFIALFVLALCAVFAIFPRYFLPVIPVVMAVTFVFATRVAAALRGTRTDTVVARALAHPERIAAFLALIIALPSGFNLARDVVRNKVDFGHTTNEPAWQAARWARTNLAPDATVMAHEALRFRHVSGLRTVNTPWDTPDAIEAVVTHHHIDHIIQTFSGEFASESNAYLVPYLQAHADHWTRRDLGPETADHFAIWDRR